MGRGASHEYTRNGPKHLEPGTAFASRPAFDAFVAATQLSVTALEKAFGQTTEAFNSAFESVLSFKQNAPELTRESARKGRHKALPLQNLSLQTQTQNQENTKTHASNQ